MAGAALGFLSGAAIGALGQYGAQKQQQKAQHEANFGQFMQQGVMTGQVDPQNPDAQKALKKYWGENYEAGMQMLQARQAAKAQLTQQLHQTLGQGDPTDIEGWRKHRQVLQDALMSNVFTDKNQIATLQKGLQYTDQQIAQLEREAERQKYESPEAKAAARRAELQAGLTPDIIGAEASKGATIAAASGAARTSAELGVKASPAGLAATEAEATARKKGEAAVPPPAKPWGAKERADAWDKAVNDADKALTKSGGFLRGAAKPSPVSRLRFARALLRKEGINPQTLDRYKPGEVILDDAGKPMIGKSGKPVTWVE